MLHWSLVQFYYRENLMEINFLFHAKQKVDKLEEAESRRVEETDHQEHKPMIMRKLIARISIRVGENV